jgi:hypothetical protein
MIRAVTLASAGRAHDALAAIREAQATLQDGDPMAADVGLALADLLVASAPADIAGAEAVLERVATLASARGCRMAHLQSLTRLVGLRRGTQHEEATRRALRELYDSLTEGFDLPQLVAARAALE